MNYWCPFLKRRKKDVSMIISTVESVENASYFEQETD
jgi:hypothetical protein